MRILVLLLLVMVAGCLDANSPTQAQARAAVLVTAESVRVMGDTCAKIAIAHTDLELAKTCEKAYDDARIALIGTSSGVDAWARFESHDSVVCAVTRALKALEPAFEAIEGRGTPLPVGADARALVLALGPCKEINP